MKHGYMGKINSAKEFQKQVMLFEQRGVPLDNVAINLSFDEFTASLGNGDTVVVCSYIGTFASLGTYLTTAIELLEKGVTIESLLEPNICINCSNSDLMRELNTLNHRLRSTSSIKSINKLKEAGKRVGRPCGSTSEQQKKVAQVEKLCQQSGITITAACKQVGCNMKTYYRLRDIK